MKKIIILLILLLFIMGCSESNSKVKECADLCFEDGGKVSQYLKDKCRSTCSQILYYGGEEAIDKTINEYKTETQVNEVVYGNKQEDENKEVKAEQNIEGCQNLDQNMKNVCVMKFVDKDETFDNISVCEWITEQKSDCLLKLSLRKAIKTKNPAFCKPTSDFNGCYVDYVHLVNECSNLKEDMERNACLFNFIKSIGDDANTEIIIKDFFISGDKILVDLSMIEAVAESDYSKCDSLCENDPKGFNRNSPDCDRLYCLSKLLRFDKSKGYQDCNNYYMKNPSLGEREGVVTCLMSQAIRDNNSQLCEDLEETSPHFVQICKDNVANYN
jgi:hypothetical protein